MNSAERTAATRNFAKLPEMAYVDVADEDVICIVKRGELGYSRTDWPKVQASANRQRDSAAQVAELNGRLKVTAAQASAMFNGSMFGWHTPSADPDASINQPKKAAKRG